MEVFLERLLMEVLAIALWRLLAWLTDRSGARSQPVTQPTAI